jgi:hypothetical protein
MSSTDQTVNIMLKLPKDIYERAALTAAGERRQLEDLLSALVAEGLDAHASVRELFDHVSEQYRARLTSEGKLAQSGDDVLRELRALREQIARELYP